jgi:hypothetical protein
MLATDGQERKVPQPVLTRAAVPGSACRYLPGLAIGGLGEVGVAGQVLPLGWEVLSCHVAFPLGIHIALIKEQLY